MLRRDHKGQLFSEDFLVSMIGVMFLLALFILFSSRLARGMGTVEDMAALGEAADEAAAQLVEAPGSPSDWDHEPQVNESISAIGLVSQNGVLDPEKTARFFAMAPGGAEYNATTALLGLTMRNMRWNATLSSLNGTLVYAVNATPPAGYFTHGTTNATVSVTRLAVLNGSVVRLSLGVWLE